VWGLACVNFRLVAASQIIRMDETPIKGICSICVFIDGDYERGYGLWAFPPVGLFCSSGPGFQCDNKRNKEDTKTK